MSYTSASTFRIGTPLEHAPVLHAIITAALTSYLASPCAPAGDSTDVAAWGNDRLQGLAGLHGDAPGHPPAGWVARAPGNAAAGSSSLEADPWPAGRVTWAAMGRGR